MQDLGRKPKKNWYFQLYDNSIQDAYDDLQRRKINYQQPEYVQNNDLICFGLSSHEVEEMQPTWTPKALHDLHIVSLLRLKQPLSCNHGSKKIKCWMQ